jgi:hypothetical protein
MDNRQIYKNTFASKKTYDLDSLQNTGGGLSFFIKDDPLKTIIFTINASSYAIPKFQKLDHLDLEWIDIHPIDCNCPCVIKTLKFKNHSRYTIAYNPNETGTHGKAWVDYLPMFIPHGNEISYFHADVLENENEKGQRVLKPNAQFFYVFDFLLIFRCLLRWRI